jgi:hypothetical protein
MDVIARNLLSTCLSVFCDNDCLGVDHVILPHGEIRKFPALLLAARFGPESRVDLIQLPNSVPLETDRTTMITSYGVEEFGNNVPW